MDKPIITNTAHQAWDLTWQTEEGRNDWSVPEPDVVNMLPILEKKGTHTVLDLGCGIGRHSVLFAEAGYSVFALDGSITAINHLKEESSLKRLPIETICAEMTNLPYTDSFFDYVLAWNVIYHGNLSVIQRVLSEIIRILKPGGIFQLTMMSKRNCDYPNGVEISYNTKINTNRDSDKHHPHFYSNSTELIQLLVGFEILSMQDWDLSGTGKYHWHIVAEKL